MKTDTFDHSIQIIIHKLKNAILMLKPNWFINIQHNSRGFVNEALAMRFVLATSKCKLFSMSWSRCYNSVSKSRLQRQTFRTFKFILTNVLQFLIFCRYVRKKSLLTLHLPNSLLGTDLVTMALFTIGTAPFRKSISGAEKIKKLQRKEGKSLLRKVLEKCLNSMQYISVSAGFDRIYREVQLISHKILRLKNSLFWNIFSGEEVVESL